MNGNAVFIRQFGSAGSDIVNGIFADTRGNIYLAGQAGDALPGQTTAGAADAFVVKLVTTQVRVPWAERGLQWVSLLAGAAVWINAAAIAYHFSGWVGLVVDFVLLGIGVVPIAAIAATMKGEGKSQIRTF